MEKQEIARLLAPFLEGSGLSQASLEKISVYLDLLIKWNAKMNLTAVRKPEEMVSRHFGESLFAARMLLTKESAVRSMIDLGSGAGFPGLPMAIYAPDVKVTLIESQNKKATFLKEAIRTMSLENVMVFAGRGEDYKGRADLVTLRAVERFADAAKVALALLLPRGRLGLMIGAGQEKQLPTGFRWEVGKAVPRSNDRILVVGVKNQESS